jgi:hypothetical protein
MKNSRKFVEIIITSWRDTSDVRVANMRKLNKNNATSAHTNTGVCVSNISLRAIVAKNDSVGYKWGGIVIYRSL